MTLGFPTIVIPAIQGGEGHHSDITLNREEISWFSECLCLNFPGVAMLITIFICIPSYRFHQFAVCPLGLHIFWNFHPANWETTSHAVRQPANTGRLVAVSFLHQHLSLVCRVVLGRFDGWSHGGARLDVRGRGHRTEISRYAVGDWVDLRDLWRIYTGWREDINGIYV